MALLCGHARRSRPPSACRLNAPRGSGYLCTEPKAPAAAACVPCSELRLGDRAHVLEVQVVVRVDLFLEHDDVDLACDVWRSAVVQVPDRDPFDLFAVAGIPREVARIDHDRAGGARKDV